MDSSAFDSGMELGTPNIEEQITLFALSRIEPDPAQPRKFRDEKAILELSESIKANGLINPILVRKGQNDKYIIVSGERRWLASERAGMPQIPARIVHGDYEVLALSENLARKDLLAIEESMASFKLLEKMQGDGKAKQKELASKLGIAESTMSEILKPAELPDDMKKEALTSPLWSRFKLLKLAKIKDSKEQKATFDKMKKSIRAKENAKNSSQQTPVTAEDKDEAKRAKEAKAVERKIKVIKNQTSSLQNNVQKAISGEWVAKDRNKLKSDLEALVKIITDFLHVADK